MDLVTAEDQRNRESRTIGDCLEFVLKEGVLMELCAYGQTDKPEGLLILCLKFISFVILDIRAVSVLSHREVHIALL